MSFPVSQPVTLVIWAQRSIREGLRGIETEPVVCIRTVRLYLSKFIHGMSWTQYRSSDLNVMLIPPKKKIWKIHPTSSRTEGMWPQDTTITVLYPADTRTLARTNHVKSSTNVSVRVPSALDQSTPPFIIVLVLLIAICCYNILL
jgi:hypothetical protein